MQSDFLVDSQTTGRAVILALSGELDLVSSPILEEAFERAYESDAELIVVDLRRLEFMDSTGLHRLVAAQQRAVQSGRRFGLVKGTEQVQRLFDLTGMADLLPLVDSPDELLEVDQTPLDQTPP
ncbi:MAG TPA: STAS domain-containing protein [Solirubrobacteraceae bacterium]|nr:STAS domain-containing protein [Solirubrobacteraceae bacterium]